MLKACDTAPVDIMEDKVAKLYAMIIDRVPYKDGKLEASVSVSISRDKRRPGILVSASARNPQTGYNYAGRQHDDDTLHHPIKGTAFFLSEPLEEITDEIIAAIQKRFDKAVSS